MTWGHPLDVMRWARLQKGKDSKANPMKIEMSDPDKQVSPIYNLVSPLEEANETSCLFSANGG